MVSQYSLLQYDSYNASAISRSNVHVYSFLLLLLLLCCLLSWRLLASHAARSLVKPLLAVISLISHCLDGTGRGMLLTACSTFHTPRVLFLAASSDKSSSEDDEDESLLFLIFSLNCVNSSVDNFAGIESNTQTWPIAGNSVSSS